MTANGRPYISDFVNVYRAALLAEECEKHPIDIYDPAVQSEWTKKLIAPVTAELPFYNQSPPPFIALVRPLAFFNMKQAWIAWFIIGVILVLSATYALARFELDDPFARLFVLVAVAASYPTWLAFRLGQPALWLFAALAAFFLLIGGKRLFLAGIAAGFSIIKLQYTPFVFIVGLIMGGGRFAAGFVSAVLALLVLSLATLGWANIISYPHALLNEMNTNVSGVSAELMQNFRGEIVLLLGGDGQAVHVITLTMLAISIAACGYLLYKRDKGSDKYCRLDRKIRLAISVLLLLGSSPHTHIQDYLLASIAAIWLWSASLQMTASISVRCLQICLIGYPVLSWLFFFGRPFLMAIYLQPYLLWALIVSLLAFKQINGKQQMKV